MSCMVEPNPTLAEQLPDMPSRIQAWDVLTVLLRPVRDDHGRAVCTPKAILVQAPAGGKPTWLPLSKIATRNTEWAGKRAPHPCEFFRIPAWLYRAKRLEILEGAESAVA